MKDSLAKHIAIFNRSDKLFPFPLLTWSRHCRRMRRVVDARRARAFEVCRVHSMWPTNPWPCRRKGGVDRRRERRRDAARWGPTLQLTFSGCTAYPYKVCHCFIILSAFLWHMKNIRITPLYCHISPGTLSDKYIMVYKNVIRSYISEQTLQ